MNFNNLLRAANQWFLSTPERALDQAYKAALMIKAIEDEHFKGKKISASSREYTDSVLSYFEADLKKYLKTIKIRLVEFKSSRSVFINSDPKKPANNRSSFTGSSQNFSLANEQQSIIIEKLDFIDKIIKKYSAPEPASKSLVPLSQVSETQIIQSDINQALDNSPKSEPKSLQRGVISKNGVVTDIDSISDKTGVLPRSILRTFNRIQHELDPQAEEEVVKNFRNSKLKTIISLKFLLTLIIVPILTQQVTKTFVVGPIIDHFRGKTESAETTNIF